MQNYIEAVHEWRETAIVLGKTALRLGDIAEAAEQRVLELERINQQLLEALDHVQEWFAQYPFNNAKFERETANELYDEITAAIRAAGGE